MVQEKITDDEKAELRAANIAAQDATNALLTIQRRLANRYELRGEDSMDAFGFITRDPSLTR